MFTLTTWMMILHISLDLKFLWYFISDKIFFFAFPWNFRWKLSLATFMILISGVITLVPWKISPVSSPINLKISSSVLPKGAYFKYVGGLHGSRTFYGPQSLLGIYLWPMKSFWKSAKSVSPFLIFVFR